MDYVEIKDFINERDAFCSHMGIEIVEVMKGRATAHMQVGPQHLNCFGIVHAGALFSLADAAFGAAANSHGPQSLAVNVTAAFVKPGLEGRLTATAHEVAPGNKLSTYAIEIADAAGKIIAAFQGTAYQRKAPFPPVSS